VPALPKVLCTKCILWLQTPFSCSSWYRPYQNMFNIKLSFNWRKTANFLLFYCMKIIVQLVEKNTEFTLPNPKFPCHQQCILQKLKKNFMCFPQKDGNLLFPKFTHSVQLSIFSIQPNHPYFAQGPPTHAFHPRWGSLSYFHPSIHRSRSRTPAKSTHSTRPTATIQYTQLLGRGTHPTFYYWKVGALCVNYEIARE